MGSKGGQTLNAFQNIRGLAEEIFGRLRRIVGHIGKGAESRHIGKIASVEAADIGIDHAAVNNIAGRHEHIVIEMVAGSEIIHRSGGNIAQRRGILQSH